ncbi:hypothetical protein [Leptonema illini]|uniref:Uncharacterized protein n=1 Tax=Leptonema illini DSM 21528 TaxID=929563 RepID=H2CAV7_9LEPT|nr:hypothetical protein [Leptonema illini]EHQ08485.1 hypothetical protein Lepil_3832 [Leptonema illini DSM 21528]
MKSIITKRLGLTAGLTGALFAAGSLQAQTFEPGIDFTADVVSNYVFRGVDVHSKKFEQDGKSYGSFNTAPAFQPSLTFNFAEGWSLNIWGSFALTGRNDVDIDGLLQLGAGDTTSSVATSYLAQLAAGNIDLATIDTTDMAGMADIIRDPSVAPGFYKEQNGLKRNDEIDVTLSYSTDSKLGALTGGIVSYNYTNISQHTASNIEMFAGFAPAILPDLSFTTYVDVATPGYSGSTYNYLSYSVSLEMGKDISLDIVPGVGYATDTSLNIQGWKNANLPITLNLGGFHIGVTGVYRMDTRFFEGDSSKSDAVSLLGETSLGDGLVVDPSLNNGIANTYINSLVTASIGNPTGYGYEYAPTQKLPKLVYFYTIGYSTSF